MYFCDTFVDLGSLWEPIGVILGTVWHLFRRLIFGWIFDGFWAGVGGVGGPPGNLLSEVSGQNWPDLDYLI